MDLEVRKKHRNFGGWTEYFTHKSVTCQTNMNFGVYLPPQSETKNCATLFWLSGLTCSEENFLTKSGAQRVAAQLGLILIVPDTSPRNLGIEGETKDWDFGQAASFYVNASEPKWSKHYRMYDYVTKELPQIVHAAFPTDPKRTGIFGHSMGGHGAMMIGLRETQFKSISAFSPIAAPSHCPWGQKAFTGYLGTDQKKWAEYDTNEILLKGGGTKKMLVDQGSDDEWLEPQLQTKRLEETIRKTKAPVTVRWQPGYDHGYFFISTFIEEHLKYHAEILG